jgi:hypothetical protein
MPKRHAGNSRQVDVDRPFRFGGGFVGGNLRGAAREWQAALRTGCLTGAL